MSAYFVSHLLQNRHYLVTGATGGAGSRTAIEISRCGGRVTIMGRDGDKVEKLRRELHGNGHMSWVFGGTEIDFNETGPFDGVFHAAGIEHIAALSQSHDGEIHKVFLPGLKMAVAMLAAIGTRKDPIVKDGGALVFMSSVAAVRGQTGMSLYCASKGAIEALVRAAAVELAPRRIRVNCLRAGAFASPMHNRIAMRSTPDAIDEYAKRHPLGFGRCDDIAHAAIFLLSDAARWVTGACWAVDGGYSAR